MKIAPRLLTVPQAAFYMGVHENTMSDYVKLGLVQPVLMPARIEDGGREGKLRTRRLIDRNDLDRLIEIRKDLLNVGAESGAGHAAPSGVKRGSYAKGWHRTLRKTKGIRSNA